MSSTIVQYLNSDAVQKNIESVLGERKHQFIASVSSLVGSNPALQTVDRKSLFSACLTAAALGLPINQNLGFAYIIPYKDQAQFQMGYKGFIQLAQRSGQFQTLNVTDVREGELKETNRLTGEMGFEWSEDRDSLQVIGYVAYMKLVNGFEKSLYMTVKELNAHGSRYSQSAKRGYGLWKDDFDAMSKKTVIKLLLSKYAPLTTDMQTAQLADQAIVNEPGAYVYPDNVEPSPEYLGAEKEKNRHIEHINNAKTVEELEEVSDYINDEEVKKLFSEKLQKLSKGSK